MCSDGILSSVQRRPTYPQEVQVMPVQGLPQHVQGDPCMVQAASASGVCCSCPCTCACMQDVQIIALSPY